MLEDLELALGTDLPALEEVRESARQGLRTVAGQEMQIWLLQMQPGAELV